MNGDQKQAIKSRRAAWKRQVVEQNEARLKAAEPVAAPVEKPAPVAAPAPVKAPAPAWPNAARAPEAAPVEKKKR